MGLLVKGEWHDKWYDTDKSDGAFEREDAQLRSWVTADGSAGPSGNAGFKAESGRYHLYVSLACPWAHRTLIFRQLKGLAGHIGVSVVSPDMLDHGWTFDTEAGSSGDPLYHSDFMHQIYTRNKSDYTGRVTVPVLWDKQQECIVSNESAEIIRMLNSAFNNITGDQQDFCPEHLKPQIDEVNERVYHTINNGVYKAGFATKAEKYEAAFSELFDSLDWLEERLTQQRYLVRDGDKSVLTEADWRLFTTLIRFDAVYFGHFKCNLRRIEDYPAISGYVRDLYQHPGVADTVDFSHIKRHYYYSHDMINPTRIVPVGPTLDFNRAHGRESLK
ncbi:glutathione S-transferase family protein [Thalassolituus sp. UBA2590]|uniref:glutathione S-transferase family protein n=1 Tax=Thalassolituus sp. UBA2590 TaxID=1947663 RepID=UPI0026492161|nr:glutathione S-transferase family protein [Thalassolituus sp. UBA2590]|tara:strand:+ start:1966 stop:2958 length:993 start_codon:yes stop_codon:yes gene_type:complete